MKNSIRLKLENLKDRFDELEALLSDSDVISDQNQFRELSKEYSEQEEVVKTFNRFQEISANLSRLGKSSRRRSRHSRYGRG